MKKTKKEIEKYYDGQSSFYDEDRYSWNPKYYKLLNESNFKTLKPYTKGKRVLEVGCGTGIILQEIAKTAKDATGADISPKMIEATKKKGLNAVQSNAEKLPFGDNDFDAVYSVKVLSHVLDIKKGLKEIARVTKKDGHMILEFYNKYSLKHIAYKIAGEDVHTRFDSYNEIKSYLPENTKIIDVKGSRIITLHAGVFKIPILSSLWLALENFLAITPLKYFASYLIVILEFKDEKSSK